MAESCTSLLSNSIAFYQIFWQQRGTDLDPPLAFGTDVFCEFLGTKWVVPISIGLSVLQKQEKGCRLKYFGVLESPERQ